MKSINCYLRNPNAMSLINLIEDPNITVNDFKTYLIKLNSNILTDSTFILYIRNHKKELHVIEKILYLVNDSLHSEFKIYLFQIYSQRKLYSQLKDLDTKIKHNIWELIDQEYLERTLYDVYELLSIFKLSHSDFTNYVKNLILTFDIGKNSRHRNNKWSMGILRDQMIINTGLVYEKEVKNLTKRILDYNYSVAKYLYLSGEILIVTENSPVYQYTNEEIIQVNGHISTLIQKSFELRKSDYIKIERSNHEKRY